MSAWLLELKGKRYLNFKVGSVKANGRKPESCFDWVLNFTFFYSTSLFQHHKHIIKLLQWICEEFKGFSLTHIVYYGNGRISQNVFSKQCFQLKPSNGYVRRLTAVSRWCLNFKLDSFFCYERKAWCKCTPMPKI
jgi:hypothetical protein